MRATSRVCKIDNVEILRREYFAVTWISSALAFLLRRSVERRLAQLLHRVAERCVPQHTSRQHAL